ncbi:BMC domain-containing protein [Alkaliphilus serpentinus]|uniref:BMC domain-containing protein n=1 Tax=Alkaliphilus serpentinus TaxID=1482731 RepID=A0A833HLD1_9FIRM|nr:BMC domain-containing protein [Alkaliphilus serpentinus]
MKNQAIGLIETYGYVAAIEAADACVKAANVSLIHCERVKGGLVTIKITGDVGAVEAAIKAGAAAAERVGRLLSKHVIPRPAFDLEKFFCIRTDEKEKTFHHTKKKPIKDTENTSTKGDHPLIKKVDNKPRKEEITKANDGDKTEKELKGMKVVELRSLARLLEGITLDKTEIKFARKPELIDAILAFYKGGSNG